MDENGNLYLLYEPEKQYACEANFDCKYEHVEMYVNGDPIIYIESVIEDTLYNCKFTFIEEPSNIMFTVSGDIKTENMFPSGEDALNEEQKKLALALERIEILELELEQLKENMNVIQTENYDKNASKFLMDESVLR